MYYEINVSKHVKQYDEMKYVHYFATAPRSITNRLDLKLKLKHFSELFPEPEYRVSSTYHPESAELIDVKKMINSIKPEDNE